MNGLCPDTIGILPAGALGVSLFHQLTRRQPQPNATVRFLERPGSASMAALRTAGRLRIAAEDGIRELSLNQFLLPPPVECFRQGRLPEVVLVCTNPDQLLDVVSVSVELIEAIAAAGALAARALPFPAMVLCANGIYHQRLRQLFVEKLEEATLLGRLPDLWPDLMPALVGRWLRGVTIQTGVRDGLGADAVYHPGPPGRTRVVGGAAAVRQRVVELCARRGGWFEDAGDLSPTRVEFDKAIVNLASNLFGLLQAIDDDGRFHRRTVRELITPAVRPQLDELTAHVMEVGRAVKAYAPGDTLADQQAALRGTLELHRDHVPSSVQWVDVELRRGRLQAQLTPTERWLLEPLVRFAEAAHLPATAAYFRGLENQLITKLRCSIESAGS